jgi:IclR family transcriptional regulator, acetate operon repressor
VSRAPDRKIRLGPTVGRLHDAYSRQLQPERDLLPILEHLSHATGETAYLETWEGGDVVIRAVLEGRQHLRVAGQIPGSRCPPHYSASGKTMLAYLGEPELTRFLDSHELTRRTPSTITDPGLLRKELAAITFLGHGEERGEFAEGVGCVAAPYFDAGGSVMGALSVSLPLSRIDASRPDMVNAVLAAGEKASRALGYSGLYPPPVERQE